MRFQYLGCLVVLLYVLPLLDATPFTLPENNALHPRANEKAGSTGSAGKQVAAPGRNAYMLFRIKHGFGKIWGNKEGWPTHSSLWIDGDDNNGAVRLDVTFVDNNKNQVVLKYVEYCKEQDVEAPEAQQTYGLKEPIGTTGVSNIDLLNPDVEGNPGILMDAIHQDPIYRTGPNAGSLSSCHDVLGRIVALTDGLKMSEKSQEWIQIYNKWVTEQAGEDYDIRSPITYIKKYGGWTEDAKHRAKWKENFTTDACPERRVKRDVACSLPAEESATAKSDSLEFAASNQRSKSPDDGLSISSRDESTVKPAPPGIVKDSRTYSYLSGWHVKFIFDIG